jgi:hypothetical protein
MDLTPQEQAQVRQWQLDCPYRIVYVARKNGESVVSAATSRRIPNKLARDGWTVAIVTGRKR